MLERYMYGQEKKIDRINKRRNQIKVVRTKKDLEEYVESKTKREDRNVGSGCVYSRIYIINKRH